MKIIHAHISVLATVAGLALLGAGVGSAQASKPPDHQVTLCHRTGAVAGGNTHAGYSIITVDIASVANAKDTRGHDGHNTVGNGPEGDIIPAYTYRSFTYAGKNLDHGGAAFLANGCKDVTVPPVTTTTTSTETPTTPPTTEPATPPTTPPTTEPVTPPTTPPTTEPVTPPVTTTATETVAGASASTTVPPASANVLGTSLTAANPLPSGAAAGQANTGKFIAGGLTGLTALLALGAGFVLRRRHGVV